MRQMIERMMIAAGTSNPDVRHTTRKAHRSRANVTIDADVDDQVPSSPRTAYFSRAGEGRRRLLPGQAPRRRAGAFCAPPSRSSGSCHSDQPCPAIECWLSGAPVDRPVRSRRYIPAHRPGRLGEQGQVHGWCLQIAKTCSPGQGQGMMSADRGSLGRKNRLFGPARAGDQLQQSAGRNHIPTGGARLFSH